MKHSFWFVAALWILTPDVGWTQEYKMPHHVDAFHKQFCASCHGGLAQGEKEQKAGDKQPKPGSLEQLIAEALKNNPDIRVAEAKAREVDAELSRTRMKVVSELSHLHAEIQSAQFAVAEAKERYDRVQKLHDQAKAVSAAELDAAKVLLQKASAELAAKQAKLPYLLGRPAGADRLAGRIDDMLMKKFIGMTTDTKTTDEEFLRRVMLDLHGRPPTPEEMKKFMKMDGKDRRAKWVEEMVNPALSILSIGSDQGIERVYTEKIWKLYFHAAGSPLTEKLRKALDATTSMNEVDVAPSDVLEHVRDKMLPGINLIVRAKFKKGSINVRLGESVAVGAVLQFLEDELDIVFVLRDYGIVVIAADERLPPGAVRVVDFWKHGKSVEPAPEPKAKVPSPKGAQAEPVRGVIDKVDAKDPLLLQISIGADNGVKTGQVLEIYRLGPAPRFVGRMEIVDIMSSRSIGRMTTVIADPQGTPRVGDQVATPPLR